MFYKPGWRPLSHLLFAVMSAYAQKPTKANGGSVDSLTKDERFRRFQAVVEDTAKAVWQLKVLMGNGECVSGFPGLLGGPWEGLRSKDVDVLVGTVGSGFIRRGIEDLKPSLQKLELQRLYGPFVGCPVLVSEDEAAKILEEKFPWHTTGLGLDPKSQVYLSQTAADLQRRPRGKPKLHDGLIEHMVRKQFGPRLGPGGDLVGRKQMSVRADAIQWIKDVTDEDISDSTMRDYLAPLYRSKDDGK